MKISVRHNRKLIWCAYLCIYLIIFLVMRCSQRKELGLEQMYTDLYLEGNVIGLYALVFCLFLIPLCSMWHMDIVAVRCSSVTRHMWLIIRQIFFRSVSFSMVLGIGSYFIIGTSVPDWWEKENVRYILIQTLLQGIGWIEIGMLFVLIFSYTCNAVWTFLLDYIVFVLFNSSVFVPRMENVAHYTRLYYMMFHIDVLSSVAEIVSVTAMNIVIILIMMAVLYRKTATMQYLPKIK